MLKKTAPIIALAPVFFIGAAAAWQSHLPLAVVLIGVGYVGFLIAYARAPRVP